ncbi:MAG: glycosyltransferase family 39 protein [Chloroflexota bacterium]
MRRWGFLIPLLLLSFWLGARALNEQAIWYDEYWSLHYAGGAFNGPLSPVDVLNGLAENDPWQAPGFFLLLNAWGALAGWSVFASRALALFIGLLSIAFMYRLGHDLFSQTAAVGAAVALGTSAFFIAYLHELRGYTLIALFSMLSVWAYWRVMRVERPSFGRQALFVIAVAGLLYTHYFAAVTAAALALYHLLFVRKNRHWWRVVVLMGLAGVLFLPWARVMLSAVSIATSAEAVTRQAATLDPAFATTQLLYLFSSGSLALFGLVGVFALRAQGRPARLVWVWALNGLALTLMINTRVPVLIHVRYLMMIVPALALLVGLGVDQFARVGVRPIYLLSFWVIAGVWNGVDPNFMPLALNGDGTRILQSSMTAIVATLHQHENPDDAAVFHIVPPGNEWWITPMLDYYMHDARLRYRQFEDIPGLQPDDDYLRQARSFIDDAPFVWTAIMPAVPSPYQVSEFQRVLEPEYADCGVVLAAPDITLTRYARKTALDTADLHFGGGVGLSLLEAPQQQDGQLSILLGIALAPTVPADTFSLGLHLDGADGNLAAQHDLGLPDAPFSCLSLRLDMSGLPAGDYGLKALVYNWQTGERLPVITDSAESDNRAALSLIHLE